VAATQSVPIVHAHIAHYPPQVVSPEHILDLIAVVTGGDQIAGIGGSAMRERDEVLEAGTVRPVKNVILRGTPVLLIGDKVRKQSG